MLCLFALTCLEHVAIDLLVLEKKRLDWLCFVLQSSSYYSIVQGKQTL